MLIVLLIFSFASLYLLAWIAILGVEHGTMQGRLVWGFLCQGTCTAIYVALIYKLIPGPALFLGLLVPATLMAQIAALGAFLKYTRHIRYARYVEAQRAYEARKKKPAAMKPPAPELPVEFRATSTLWLLLRNLFLSSAAVVVLLILNYITSDGPMGIEARDLPMMITVLGGLALSGALIPTLAGARTISMIRIEASRLVLRRRWSTRERIIPYENIAFTRNFYTRFGYSLQIGIRKGEHLHIASMGWSSFHSRDIQHAKHILAWQGFPATE